jgi:hypothetical protein
MSMGNRLGALVSSRWYRLLAASLGALLPVVWMASLLSHPEEAVKLRDAFIAEVGQPGDFTWTPHERPESFRHEGGPIPSMFSEIAAGLSVQGAQPSEFPRALAIARHLLAKPHEGRPIKADNATAYRQITEEGGGYCADFTQVFNAVAVAAKIPVREWGIAFYAFGSGHAFNEIYDRVLGKWILVDSFHALYFVDPQTREPLSVLEVHDRLLRIDKLHDVAVQPIMAERVPFKSEAIALDYYRRGMHQLFLLWGNNVFEVERVAPIRWASHVSRSLEQAIAIALGIYPEMKIYPRGVNERDLREMRQARDRFVIAFVAFCLALPVFGLQIVHLMRDRRTTVGEG